ncbi:MAG: FAD-dependent oxidoreductase, partial [Pseudomonadota bacterium]
MSRPPPDVTILGAGIIGICCALTLLERGLTVRIIDRLPPGEATSHGNAGVISPYSVVPQSMPGVWKNVPRWLLDPKGPVKLRWRDLPKILPWVIRFMANTRHDKVAEISGAMAFLMAGNVDAYRRYLKGTGEEGLIADALNVTVFRDAPPDPQDLQFQLRDAMGCEIAFIGAGDLRDLEPDLSADYRFAAIFKGQARTVNPGRLCKVLAEKAAMTGVEMIRAEVIGIRPMDAEVEITTESGTLMAQKLILAGGVWSGGLLRQLGIRLPLIAERGYHLDFAEPGVEIRNSISDGSAKVIVSLMETGVRIAGTAEFAAVDAPPNYARADALAPLAKRL